MHRSSFNILVDPISKLPLQLKVSKEDADGNVIEGKCFNSDHEYPIWGGIPRFVMTEDSGQKQTEESFGYKWQQLSSYESLDMHDATRQWLVQRYGFESPDEMKNYFGSRKRILDAGCGSGFSSSLWMTSQWRTGCSEWWGADISAAIDVAQQRLEGVPGTRFIQADVLNLPFDKGTFDTIFSEGVLHHTPSTEQALKTLVPLLESGGEMMFYVYRKKSPVREFTDDYIRDIISPLPPDEAWDMLRPLTKLGKALAELNVEVEIPEDIPLLEIKAGNFNVQRLIYWHFAKLFWNSEWAFEQNHHVNFDWYHPRYAHRQTEEDVRRWCQEAKLSIFHLDGQESGFTVRAIKN